MNSIELILVRHSETMANKAGIYLGYGESKLSEEGYRQASKLCRCLESYEIDEIYISPSNRVSETLKGYKELSNCNIVESLREINFGEFEVRKFEEIINDIPNLEERMLSQGDDYIFPGGESLAQMNTRVIGWMQTNIFSGGDKNNKIKHSNNRTYLIVTHAGPIRSILSYVLSGGNNLHWNFRIDTASITRVRISDNFPVIDLLNYSPN